MKHEGLISDFVLLRASADSRVGTTYERVPCSVKVTHVESLTYNMSPPYPFKHPHAIASSGKAPSQSLMT